MKSDLLVSVVIKALNEEELIARCIESVLVATEGVTAEIIVADSLSTDKTVEIASRYPVKIVQLENIKDRGAGAAAQLGYQFASGRYVYILDGDMEMQPGFLQRAIKLLESDSHLAGVAGTLQDTRINNMFDRHRVKTKPSAKPGYVPWLGGGGLYKKQAIESVGYIAHRFLPAGEEAELGLRLSAQGWKMMRLPDIAVKHTGHSENTMQMLARHWRNGYAKSAGMMLRDSLHKPHFVKVLKIHKEPLSVLSLIMMMLVFAPIKPFVSLVVAGVWVSLFFMLLAKKSSLLDASFSFFHWHYRAVAILFGVWKPCSNPMLPIPAKVVQ